MRFLLSRRWALFALGVVVLACACYLLGRWQFHRLHDREATNAQVRTNLAAAPAPVGSVLSPGRPVPESREWRRVSATGTYLPAETVVVRYQTREGTTGVDIVTPLRTTAGPLLLVDRGWLRTPNVGAEHVDSPPPPSGRVRVVGWVRVNATGSAATVSNGSTRAVSSVEIAKTLDGRRVYGGFVDVQHQTPAPQHPLAKAEMPDLGNGPHFFYGLQWWFFGVLAVFGFFYLAYDERKKLTGRATEEMPDDSDGAVDAGSGEPEVPEASQRPEHPAVHWQHHAADEARSG